MYDRSSALLAPLLLLAVPTFATAHEDDPKILDRVPTYAGPGFLGGGARSLGGTSNAAALGFSAQGMEVHSWLTFDDLGGTGGAETGNDCWGYVSPSGREYALMGTSLATVVVEVTDPANATVVARLDGPTSLWRDMKVYQDHMYAVSEGGEGIQVFDLSGVDAGVVTHVGTIDGNGTSATHNVAIDEVSGFLYRCGGGSNGLRIYSLSNPAQPQYVGSWGSRYVHDAQIVTYTSGPYAGKQIAFCCGGLNGGHSGTGLTILDVTQKWNISVLSQLGYPGKRYSHQGWLSEDRTRFYLGDELDERVGSSVLTTRVFDVSDPGNATLTGEFTTDYGCISHNMYERDGLLFQANYTWGVRVFDVAANPDQPEEIAFFDTAPDRDAETFNGCWNVYPFLPSGTVIASDLERGLFVLSVDALGVTATEPTVVAVDGTTVTMDVTERTPGTFDAATPTLEVRALGIERSLPMDPTGVPGQYEARIPGFPCGTEVQWWVSARTLGGIESTFPAAAPVVPYVSYAGAATTLVRHDDMETDAGWARDVAGDTAPRGLWVRDIPLETSSNPGNDSSPGDGACWFTGQAPVQNNNWADVDAGATTLLSPVFDLSTMSEPVIRYDRWYHTLQNGNQDDVFDVEISADGGQTWQLLERVGPTGPGTVGGWIRASFRVRDHVEPTAQVQLRFIASDTGAPTIVEAAIDEFSILDVACGVSLGTAYCQANVNSTGLAGELVAVGSDVLADGDLTLVARRLPPGQVGMFIASTGQLFSPNLGGGDGNLCVGPSIGRFADDIGAADAAGALALTLDLGAISTANGSVAAQVGDTWNFQAWHRDSNPGSTSNLTQGLEVTLQ